MAEYIFHLIANAHIDPVWLWDWREGLNEGLITLRTILDLMDEDRELTFIRGEAAIYQHIEQHDPATFERIKQHVAEGRWDVVGGTYIQPDTNLPATETMARHFARSQHYFAAHFGQPVRVAWAADSFGHSGGLPEILAQAGIEAFAFTRPAAAQLPLAKPLFWWEGVGGSRVLAYRPAVGWYGSERHDVAPRLDSFLEMARGGDSTNIGVFYGLGNHGGGPTRRHLEDIRRWAAAHPEVQIVHSGLHRFFAAVHAEIAGQGDDFLPTHRGEMNFCLRGCYSSVAKFKFAYRKTEAVVSRAERTDAAISAMLGQQPADLGEPWDTVLFNSFHDILPGSSIERAFDDQIAWLGGAVHQSQRVELAALNALALRVDTAVTKPPGDKPSAMAFLVWNPHPHAYRGHIELETALDYRPIWDYHQRPDELPVEVRGADREPLPFQLANTECHFMPDFPWRKRTVVPVELPPLGWSVLSMGWVEGAQVPVSPGPHARTPQDGCIDNGIYAVTAQAGERSVAIFYRDRPVFGDAGISAITVEDPWGSWGGMAEEPESLDLSTVRCHWVIDRVATLETGPERAVLWVRMVGGDSRLELTFMLYRGRAAVDVGARVFWNERSARLKLVMPAGDEAEFDVPGGSVRRGPCGEVPGGRWVRVQGSHGNFGFASDALYNFDCKDGAVRATVVRAGGYATDVYNQTVAEPWRPVVDTGELRFRFLLTTGDENLPVLARELEEPPIAMPVPPKPGDLPRQASLAELAPTSLRLLALKPAEDGDGWVLRVQEVEGRETEPHFVWLGLPLSLGTIRPRQIATWRLMRDGAAWKAVRANIFEALG
jgi:alpha-mannosidase